MRRTGKAAAKTKAVQEAGGERTIGMGNGSRRTAEDNEKRARVNGTFADNREVKSAVGARLSNAKRRQCPSAGKSCVSAVMPRAARIGEPNRPGRNMNQQRPAHGFRQQRRPCRRGEGMRRAGILHSVYVRTHDARNNRKIRPEICPNMGAARNFFENFKKISFSVQRTGTKYRLYNIRTLLCTSKCSASRAFLRPHTQNSHPIPCKPVNIRKPAHGLKQIRSEMCKTAPDPD